MIKKGGSNYNKLFPPRTLGIQKISMFLSFFSMIGNVFDYITCSYNSHNFIINYR